VSQNQWFRRAEWQSKHACADLEMRHCLVPPCLLEPFDQEDIAFEHLAATRPAQSMHRTTIYCLVRTG
jgi:hypothetical protein